MRSPLGGCAAPARARTGSNAYMLVYIRLADWERVMRDSSSEDIEVC